MFVQEIIFYNRAPFNNLHLKFKSPGVSVLTGINGRGKTTILSYIVDAFYEMARPVYRASFEGKENKLYRVSSNNYTINSTMPSLVYIRFVEGNNNYDYIDVRGKLTESLYQQIISYEDRIDYAKIKDSLDNGVFARFMSKSLDVRTIRKAFSSQLFTYFPSYRFEIPGYIGSPYKPDITNNTAYVDELPNQISVNTSIDQLSSWLLDITLDRYVYKDNNIQESILWNDINVILRLALSSKKFSGQPRFGIGKRGQSGQRVSVVEDINDDIITIASNLHDLSSGETAILEIFGEIFRQGDQLENNASLNNIKGIVLIDEIDKNLHIKLQKEVLPKLLFIFPNIQFIVTSHSPFFNMGLANEKFIDKTTIFDLDNNGLETAPTDCEIFEEVFNMFMHDNKELENQINELKSQLANIHRPLILTEGKTDIELINKAKEVIGIDIDYDIADKDNQPDGDSKLLSMLKELSKVHNPHKIIGIFDCDVPQTVKALKSEDGKLYKDFGNNVYGFCLPVPASRSTKGQNAISIEYLFSDDEIKSILPNGCRLFLGTEFKGNSMWHNDNKDLTLKFPTDKGKDKIIENTGGQAVYDKDENNHLAKKSEFADAVRDDKIEISKESWENFRAIFDIIEQILKR